MIRKHGIKFIDKICFRYRDSETFYRSTFYDSNRVNDAALRNLDRNSRHRRENLSRFCFNEMKNQQKNWI